MEKTAAIAFPGLPVIFAEGMKKPFEDRVSFHNSVGLAITDLNENVMTETSIIKNKTKKILFKINNKKISGERGKGMLKVVKLTLKKSGKKIGLNINSKNHGILSGSSDSGAAALVVALDHFLQLNLEKEKLLNIGRFGSETVFRSLYGGLTKYETEKKSKADVIATADELKDLVIYTIPFEGKRHSADDIHKKIVTHKNYKKRAAGIDKKIHDFENLIKNKKFTKALELMELDAREFHSMVEDLGVRIINDEMRELCNAVEEMRKTGLNAFWDVAAGNVVYVFCLNEQAKDVRIELRVNRFSPIEYKVADSARVI